ncbi:unnamed protein product, partial [Acanthocheilonema viteae]
MDDDIVDLLVVSSVTGIGFIALIYFVTKTYSNKIKKRLLCFEDKTKHFIAISNVVVVQCPKSVITFQKFSEAGEGHTESSGKILIDSIESLKKQSTKRGGREVEDKLDNKSSFSSSKMERLPYALLSSI